MAILFCVLVSPLAHAADPQIENVSKGESKDLYFQINVSGTVYVKIAAKPGESACANFWWIKWPLGNIKALGRHCNFARFEIPGITDLALSSKLRVGGGENSLGNRLYGRPPDRN